MGIYIGDFVDMSIERERERAGVGNNYLLFTSKDDKKKLELVTLPA